MKIINLCNENNSNGCCCKYSFNNSICNSTCTTGATGPSGATGPVGATGATGVFINAYAEYTLLSNVLSGNFIPLEQSYDIGGLTSLSSDENLINLKSGYVYQVCYTIQGSSKSEYRYQINTLINNTLNLLLPTSSSNVVIDGSAIGSVSSCFLVTANISSTVGLKMYTHLSDSISMIGCIYVYPIASIL